MVPSTRLASSLMSPSSRSLNTSISSSTTTSPSRSSRKAPQCAQCGRPRAGHPRSGCPNAATPVPESISAAFRLEPEVDVKPFVFVSGSPGPPNRRLSSVKPIPQRGLLAGELTEEDLESEYAMKNAAQCQAKSVRRNLKPPKVKKPRQRMPGTFDTPFSSFESIGDSDSDDCDATQEPPAPPPVENIRVTRSRGTHRPLKATMSVLERQMFLSEVAEVALTKPTMVFKLPRNDIDIIEQGAIKKGFHARVVQRMEDDGHDLLILGMDGGAVQRLVDRDPAQGGRGGLTTAAGGAVLGAAAALTGLAFS